MNTYGFLGKLTATDGSREQLLEILLEAAESMKDVPDCQLYVVHVVEDDPHSVWVYEAWSSQEAHQASLSLEVTQTLIQRAKPLLAGIERLHTLIPKGGKGYNIITNL